MVTLTQKRAAEQDARALLDDHGLPQPDVVEYGQACVRLLWYEEKVCLEVDIEEHHPASTWTKDLEEVEAEVPRAAPP